MIQFHGRPKFLEDFILELYGNRAYGNIAQANLYANYLAVGESALLYLWLRARVPTAYVLPALMLLVLGSALAGSRSTLLYALWFAVLGSLAMRDETESRRLKLAVYGLGGCDAGGGRRHSLAQQSVSSRPAERGRARSHACFLGRNCRAAPTRMAVGPAPCLPARPVAGVGIGEFAGAAFDLGLDPVLVQRAELWTSPHNLPLHLLAETGIVGAGPRARRRSRMGAAGRAAVPNGGATCRVVDRRCGWSGDDPFPDRISSVVHTVSRRDGAAHEASAQRPSPRFSAMSRPSRTATTAACADTCCRLDRHAGNYLRLHAAYVTGTTVTLARAADAQRDAATMRELTHGLMAPVAELWIVMGAPLDKDNLAAKVAMSGRVARFWPIYSVLGPARSISRLRG